MASIIVFKFGFEIRGIDIWVALGCTRRSPAGFGTSASFLPAALIGLPINHLDANFLRRLT